MSRKSWFMASIFMLAVSVAPAAFCRADDQDLKDIPVAKDLPAAVLEAAMYHVPDLTVDDVSTRLVKGHPLVYIIDGQSCDRGVVLAIEETGDVREIRFHKFPDGVKPTKLVHAIDDVPDAVRETAERVMPGVEIAEAKSMQSEGEQRIYHLNGTVLGENDDFHHVILTIEENGDLLEARVIKPMKEVATSDTTTDALPERDPNDD